MAGHGLDVAGHLSRQVTADDLARASLVLAMAREHLRQAVVIAPDAWPRAFTIRELVRRGAQVGRRTAGGALDELAGPRARRAAAGWRCWATVRRTMSMTPSGARLSDIRGHRQRAGRTDRTPGRHGLDPISLTGRPVASSGMAAAARGQGRVGVEGVRARRVFAVGRAATRSSG